MVRIAFLGWKRDLTRIHDSTRWSWLTEDEGGQKSPIPIRNAAKTKMLSSQNVNRKW